MGEMPFIDIYFDGLYLEGMYAMPPPFLQRGAATVLRFSRDACL